MAIEQGDGPEKHESDLTALEDDRLLVSLVAVVLLCLLLGAVLMALWDPISAVILLTVMALVVTALTLLGCSRLGRQDAILTTLAIAVERGMPLAAAIEALADQERGRSQRRLLALARLLNNGAPLPQALNLIPGILPRETTASIAVGWASGCLAGALREAADTQRPGRVLRAELAPRLVYLLAMLLIMKLIVSFILYFILPKFEAIFYDFGVGLPRVTVGVVQATHWLTGWAWPILFVMTACELILAALLPFWLTGWLGPNFFGMDRMFRSRHTAPVLRALAWVVEGGKPLSSGVEALIRNYPAGWVQRRLGLALHDLSRGTDFWQALRDRSLIGPADAAILESARRVGNLPWALREAADGAARRSLVRIQRGITILSTLVVVALGVSVLVLATAFFAPLVTLIESLTR